MWRGRASCSMSLTWGGVQVSLSHAFRQWGKFLLATSNLVWKSGPLQLPDMKILRTELKKMGEAHKACEMNVTLSCRPMHVWIDHLFGWVQQTSALPASQVAHAHCR